METKHSFYRVVDSNYAIFYCRYCHEKSDVPIRDDQMNMAFHVLEDIECPSCKKATDKSFNAGKKKREERTFFNGMRFFEAKDSNKIRIFFDYKVINFFNQKLQQEHYSEFFVLNLNTANTYQLRNVNTNSFKKTTQEQNWGPDSIFNMTFSPHKFARGDSKLNITKSRDLALINLIEDKLSKKLGYKVKSIIEYLAEYNEGLYSDTINMKIKGISLPESQRINMIKLMVNPNISIEYLATYIRVPNMNPFIFRKSLSDFSHTNLARKIKRSIKPFSDSPVKELINKFKLNNLNKPSMKIIHRDIRSLALFKFYDFIKDKNNLFKIVSYFINHSSFYPGERTNDNKKLYKFFNTIYEQVGENSFVNKIIKSNDAYHTFYDSARMYFKILEEYHDNNTDLDFDFRRKNINEIHDELTYMFNKISHKSIKIEYEENALELNDKIEEYDIILPEETLELVNVGYKMKICVGSYSDRVVSHKCTIVVWYKNNMPEICIEIVDNSIVQAKTKCNNKPNQQQIELIKEWAKKNNLIISTSDIEDFYFLRNLNELEGYLNV